MKRQILPLLFAGMAAYLVTGCCCRKQVAVVKNPNQVAVVKKPAVLAPTGPVIAEKREILPPTGRVIVKEPEVPPPGPILVREYTVPAPKPGEVVVVQTSDLPPKPEASAWYFSGIRWVWIP